MADLGGPNIRLERLKLNREIMALRSNIATTEYNIAEMEDNLERLKFTKDRQLEAQQESELKLKELEGR